MAMIAITAENFDELVLKADKPVLVDIWAAWCGPCKALSPILDKISEQNPEKMDWYKVDADANPAIVEKFGVTSIPTVLVFNNGDVVHSVKGAKPKAEMEKELAEYL